ncbi:hypothetical protein [Andreprevotia chitinilytica]|uniref:hypothetical protein n=1 Tax=Andreprevotia chitinilytica TaxID=396808 RepID=UPI000552BF14|nr:hypothetical protein [Andreprevotia chitinilytica]
MMWKLIGGILGVGIFLALCMKFVLLAALALLAALWLFIRDLRQRRHDGDEEGAGGVAFEVVDALSEVSDSIDFGDWSD